MPPEASSAGDVSTLTPLIDFGAETYQGFAGGLYPDGRNEPPARYLEAGLGHARLVLPRNRAGARDGSGKIGLVSVGMSNTRQEFGAFKPLADEDEEKDRRVVVVNGSQGGVDALMMANPHHGYWHALQERVAEAGLSNQQVQVVWLKQAMARENRAFPRDARHLQRLLAAIIQTLRGHFPQLRLVYLASRTYAGYATTELNPEPHAYQSGFAVKWLIEDAIRERDWVQSRRIRPGRGAPNLGPWLAWGPYLWTHGTEGRSDSFVWSPEDTANDGTHPSEAGQEKVGRLLLSFFKEHETARSWFLRGR